MRLFPALAAVAIIAAPAAAAGLAVGAKAPTFATRGAVAGTSSTSTSRSS